MSGCAAGVFPCIVCDVLPLSKYCWYPDIHCVDAILHSGPLLCLNAPSPQLLLETAFDEVCKVWSIVANVAMHAIAIVTLFACYDGHPRPCHWPRSSRSLSVSGRAERGEFAAEWSGSYDAQIAAEFAWVYHVTLTAYRVASWMSTVHDQQNRAPDVVLICASNVVKLTKHWMHRSKTTSGAPLCGHM